MITKKEEVYWSQRYKEQNTGWDIGYPSTPIKNYIDQLKDKSLHILIPGAGNAYEAEYLLKNGFTNVSILDISEIPLKEFKKRNPNFPKNQLIHANFFEHIGAYDLIIEQTFFCSFIPSIENRTAYAKKMASILKTNGKLVGLWFDIPLSGNLKKRPFGGNKSSYLKYLETHFKTITFEASYNSIPARQGNELFGIFIKK